MRTRVLAAVGGAALVAGLSACSLTGGADPGGAGTPTTPAGGAGGGAASPPANPQVLRLVELDGFSPEVVVNGKGRTVYRFENDSNNPPKTTCVDDCLKTWQPVLAPNGVQIGDGLEEDLVGTVTRPDDDSKQLTLNGWPLYYFHKDLKLGQTAGHGVADKWFAITGTGGTAKRSIDTGAPVPKPQVLRPVELDGFAPAVVVNGKGRTIYRFENDSNDPPKTTCANLCLKTWQPVLAPNGVQVDEGIDSDLVGTVKRPDGTKQLTLNGWPLYYFHKDLKLGQTAGHGTGDKWFAITAKGGKAKKQAS